MANHSRTPERCMLPRADRLLSPPLLKRKCAQVEQTPLPSKPDAPLPSLLLLPVDFENCPPQENRPRLSLKPRTYARKNLKPNGLPLSDMADLPWIGLTFDDTANVYVKRRRTSLSSTPILSLPLRPLSAQRRLSAKCA
jgi:hypothetical protein